MFIVVDFYLEKGFSFVWCGILLLFYDIGVMLEKLVVVMDVFDLVCVICFGDSFYDWDGLDCLLVFYWVMLMML